MIERWSEGAADDNMSEEILVELGDVVRRHPWWRARTRLTMRLLDELQIAPPAMVLDAGCGWGATLEALEARGYRAVGMDVSRRILERLDRPGRALVEADLNRPLGAAATYRAVLALDVIEHLDDDREAVRRLAGLVEPGGVLIVSVPALPELFSEFDAVQGHRRRYLPDTLAAAFDGAGLHIDRAFWWGRWLVPVLRRQRARPRSRPGDSPADVYRRHLSLPPRAASWLLSLAFRVEERPALRGALRCGTSLFIVARRP
jgi:2-polyprenyl-3-methyl-5-hydroxy-6-metoxy-1,4-benzoquinol methylase